MKTTITEKANAVKPLPARMEDEVKHTSGPWTALDHITVSEHTPEHVEVRGPNGIEAIADCFYGRSNAEVFANARLIAAAPTLLEALKEVKRWLLEDEQQQGAALVSKEKLNDRFQDVRAAIAQAEGAQQ